MYIVTLNGALFISRARVSLSRSIGINVKKIVSYLGNKET